MSRLQIVRLVVAREIRVRLRSRLFQVSTAISMLIVVGATVLPTLERNPLRSTVRLGVVGTGADDMRAGIDRVRSLVGATVVVRELPDEESANQALRDDEIHLAYIDGQRLVSKKAIPPTDITTNARVARALSLLPAFSGAPLPLESLEAPKANPPSPIGTFFGIVLIYMFISLYGTMTLNGVAEEKGSRVVEILLSTIRPFDMLVGKVVGIGTVAIVQALSIVAARSLAARSLGQSALGDRAGADIAALFGWFLLAYLFYSFVYAAAGAMVNRQEEAGGVAFPITLPLLVSYIASTSALGGNDSRLLRVLSFLPPTAPIAMPMRVSIGVASPAQVVAAVAITILGVIVVAILGARVYERSIVKMGTRVKLRQALRAA